MPDQVVQAKPKLFSKFAIWQRGLAKWLSSFNTVAP
jgi:hypothetical protein